MIKHVHCTMINDGFCKYWETSLGRLITDVGATKTNKLLETYMVQLFGYYIYIYNPIFIIYIGLDWMIGYDPRDRIT